MTILLFTVWKMIGGYGSEESTDCCRAMDTIEGGMSIFETCREYYRHQKAAGPLPLYVIVRDFYTLTGEPRKFNEQLYLLHQKLVMHLLSHRCLILTLTL